ncbi:MAG TPA: phytanoyl-CoA dioxygenase family protein [Candidatus Limnocylindria bacterium]|jgi:hypothetical protein|nr:phytanoyl-CoA dioxygenase family protein [Candidatus Limnocylindria bacterium]
MKALDPSQVERFIEQGYLRLEHAFPQDLAEKGRLILWRETGCEPLDRSTWTRPVIWLWDHTEEPFRQAVNTAALHSVFDELVGHGRWLPRQSLGTFPVRFPNPTDTGDTGWHVDASFPGEDSRPDDFHSWRVNVRSRGRALLMLFLFSDVSELDAPTRIRVGSHLEVARMLAQAGEAGLRPGELDYGRTDSCEEVQATGAAGTVYLCHPFLVHAAQVNRGTQPRFMAQPPLFPAGPLELDRADATGFSPVERAIRRALGKE